MWICATSDPGRQARIWHRQALAACQQAGDRHGEAETLRDVGDLCGAVGRHEAARQSWRQALAIADELGGAAVAAAIRSRLERRGPGGGEPGIQAHQGSDQA